jgi:hypothetical protein
MDVFKLGSLFSKTGIRLLINYLNHRLELWALAWVRPRLTKNAINSPPPSRREVNVVDIEQELCMYVRQSERAQEIGREATDGQGCQIFLGTRYQNRKMYQMNIKCTKRS